MKPVALLVLCFFAFTLCSACSVARPSLKERSFLHESVYDFHRSLVEADVLRALRYAPEGERRVFEERLRCFQSRIRVIDSQLGEIQTDKDPSKARVRVLVTGHGWTGLTTWESLWEETWTFENQRWVLRLDFEPFASLPAACEGASR